MTGNSADKSVRCTLESLDISRIDVNNREFGLHFFRNPSPSLVESVKQFGIIYPPLVRAAGSGFQILDGFLRIEAARLCNTKVIQCSVCDENLDHQHLARFLLSIALSGGLPHILDRAVIVQKMTAILPQDRVVRDILPLLGLQPNTKVLQRLVPLSRLDEEMGRALLDQRINHDMALRLMELEPEVRSRITTLFLYFRYSQSKQFEILDNLLDIAEREQVSPVQVLEEVGWNGEGPEPPEENRVAAGEALRNELRDRRYPTMTGLERSWRTRIKSLRLPPSISLTPPSSFEGSTYRISFAFKTLEEYKALLSRLKDMGEQDEWTQLLPG
ncbi:MAG: ParB N-terminal domain-containing protein [bacterium]